MESLRLSRLGQCIKLVSYRFCISIVAELYDVESGELLVSFLLDAIVMSLSLKVPSARTLWGMLRGTPVVDCINYPTMFGSLIFSAG